MFLKFLTGSSSLPLNAHLTIKAQYELNKEAYVPIPVAHTCGYQMEISPIPCSYQKFNDHTKEAFIECIKGVALKEVHRYSLGY
jgi:hypothetical protein